MPSHLIEYISDPRRPTYANLQTLEENRLEDVKWEWKQFSSKPTRVFLQWTFEWDVKKTAALVGKVTTWYLSKDGEWIEKKFDSIVLRRSGKDFKRMVGPGSDMPDDFDEREFMFRFTFHRIPPDDDDDVVEIDDEVGNRYVRSKSSRIEKMKRQDSESFGNQAKLRKTTESTITLSSGSSSVQELSDDEERPVKDPVYKIAFKGPRIDLDERFAEYNATKDLETRKRMLKDMACLVKKHSDVNLFRTARVEYRTSWQDDPVIRNNWKYRIDGKSGERFARLMGERIAKMLELEDGAIKTLDCGCPKKCDCNFACGCDRECGCHRDKTVGPLIDCPDWLKPFVYNYRHQPPRTRILIHPNISLDKNNVIPVYSDIKTETLDTLYIPDALTYEYTDVNRFNSAIETDLDELLKEGAKEENVIRCDCHSPGQPFIPCYENKDCPCAQTNIAIQGLQSCDKKDVCEFKTFDQIVFPGSKNPFFEFVGFACSDACACKGRCSNNALYLAEQRKIPMEIYRANPIMGFGIRSPVAIKAGTAFLEFTGDVQSKVFMPREDIDYAYCLNYLDDDAWHKFVLNHWDWTDQYVKILRRAHRQEYYINPKSFGNAGRTALHSCLANAEILRVYQKSLSPVHARMVLVAIEDILPGMPITIDYGEGYVKQQMNNSCLCGTFVCRNGNLKNKLRDYTESQIANLIIHLQAGRHREYMDLVKAAQRDYKERHSHGGG